MRWRSALLGLLVAAVGTTAFGAVFFELGPDPVIFPEQKVPIYFTHNYHVRKPDPEKGIKGEGLDCEFCHENISDQKKAGQTDIPGHDTCDTCHAEWIGDEDEPAPVAECARCHKDLTGTSTRAAKLTIPAPRIRFPHKDHVKAGVACLDCHPKVPDKSVATRDDYPTMDRCIECHEEKNVPTRCTFCHLGTKSGRVITDYPGGKLMPKRYHSFAIHDGDFLRDHATPAQRDRTYCAKCHTSADCLDCHDGIGRDVRYHPSDWIAIHFVKAKKDDVRCESCHRLQTFCIDCHMRTGVATVGTTVNPFERRTIRLDDVTGAPNGPHPMAPDGWLEPTSRNFHGFHAQRNIRACASCHEEQYCIQCHGSAFGGGASQGGNPHGPNPERLKGSTAAARNARMCLKCHHPSDPSWR